MEAKYTLIWSTRYLVLMGSSLLVLPQTLGDSPGLGSTSAVRFSSVTAASTAKEISGMHRSESGNELRCDLAAKIRRSRSEPQLRCSLIAPKAAATTTTASTTRMKSSRSVGMLPFHFSVPFEASGTGGGEIGSDHMSDQVEGHENLVERIGKDKRANWIERLLELRTRWRNRQQREEEENGDGGGDYYCGVEYGSDEEMGTTTAAEEEWDSARFERFLTRVPWSETKLFSKLAFLCNMAYVIPKIKTEDLRRYYDLRPVTSSLEKKSEAAIKAKLDSDSPRQHPDPNPIGSDPETAPSPRLKRPIRPSVAYEIAASAASYVHSRAKGLLSFGGGKDGAHEAGGAVDPTETRGDRVYKSEVAAFVAASTMTAVVAAEEDARLEAARGLRTLQSSPCEWFVCDDPNTCTRCFVIQGSDSLASWQANLLFEPIKFEETEVLVHRGIYEAAKGIYQQFMPEILAHLNRYSDKAKFRFTGHSLGGSLSLLVSLMLRARGAVPPSSLLPVVTFGSPSVFCGGRRVVDELGLDEEHVCSVMMHRDIVPRAFSCSYPNQVAQLLKRLNGAFRSHPCLNSEKVLYSPLGKLFILQPDEKSSPAHPLLPSGAALYSLNMKDSNGAPNPGASSALKAFLNSPHPLETLSKLTAYGSEGTILRDHVSSNYLKAINGLIRQHTKSFVRRSRKQRLSYLWPLLTTTTGTGHRNSGLENPGLVHKEVVTGV